jgi:hypothetical protein
VFAVFVFVACQIACDELMEAAFGLAWETASILAHGLHETFDPYNWAYSIILYFPVSHRC